MEQSPAFSSAVLPTCFGREVEGPPLREKAQAVLRVWVTPEPSPETAAASAGHERASAVRTPAYQQQRTHFT